MAGWLFLLGTLHSSCGGGYYDFSTRRSFTHTTRRLSCTIVLLVSSFLAVRSFRRLRIIVVVRQLGGGRRIAHGGRGLVGMDILGRCILLDSGRNLLVDGLPPHAAGWRGFVCALPCSRGFRPGLPTAVESYIHTCMYVRARTGKASRRPLRRRIWTRRTLSPRHAVLSCPTPPPDLSLVLECHFHTSIGSTFYHLPYILIMKLSIAIGILVSSLSPLSSSSYRLSIGSSSTTTTSDETPRGRSSLRGLPSSPHERRRQQRRSFLLVTGHQRGGDVTRSSFDETSPIHPCDPTSADPDIGILSCGGTTPRWCRPDSMFALGGVCTRVPTAAHSLLGSSSLASTHHHHVVDVCDPWSLDPTSGILSCGTGWYCQPNGSSIMMDRGMGGGTCQPTNNAVGTTMRGRAASPWKDNLKKDPHNHHQRHLQSSNNTNNTNTNDELDEAAYCKLCPVDYVRFVSRPHSKE